MSRRKGERTPKMNMRAFPHFVDIDLPENGLGARLMDMHGWHFARGLMYLRGSGASNAVRWCFSDPETADAFAAEFDGRRVA